MWQLRHACGSSFGHGIWAVQCCPGLQCLRGANLYISPFFFRILLLLRRIFVNMSRSVWSWHHLFCLHVCVCFRPYQAADSTMTCWSSELSLLIKSGWGGFAEIAVTMFLLHVTKCAFCRCLVVCCLLLLRLPQSVCCRCCCCCSCCSCCICR